MLINTEESKGKTDMQEKRPKILILFYSLYGHILPLAEAAKVGVEVGGGEVIFKQVKEIIPRKNWSDSVISAKNRMKAIPFADPYLDLKNIDGIIVGSAGRYGSAATQMRAFWDETHRAWAEGLLNGKPAAVFGSTATQHGGHEFLLLNLITTLLSHGCMIVSAPFGEKSTGGNLIRQIEKVSGGTPFGASTITGELGERKPSIGELELSKNLGQSVALVAKKLLNN